MHKLAEICVKRPVFATVIVLSLVVVGWFAYQQLRVDRFPKVDFPTIVISTRLVGAAPEDIETDITDKIEEAETPSAASTSCSRSRPRASRR